MTTKLARLACASSRSASTRRSSIAAPDGLLQGKAQPAAGTLPNLPFSVHHQMLTVYGIHLLENLRLAELVKDKVWTACAMVLPTLDKGAAGGAVRPVAIGVPGQR